VDGDVYYRVKAFAGYGKLSGRSLDDMLAGARVEVDERKRKQPILPSGKRPKRVNQAGTAPGDRDGRVGILSVRSCPPNTWVTLLIFMAAELI
jgi:hypothetical protein